MKKLIIFLLAPLLLLVIAGTVFLRITAEKPPEGLVLTYVDTLATNLPAEETQARKELSQARRMMGKLVPNKPYIVIDTHANRIYLRTADSTLLDAVCSTGSGGELIDSVTGRKWTFNTPRGVFKIRNKLKDPWWRAPDWDFIERGEPIPKNEAERYDENVMGEYAMGFGDGFFIHGTIYERLLGINVTHGCVRVGETDLEKLFEMTPVNTQVYIF